MDEKLLSLPWEIQLALGSGYAAYMLAYLGIREHHKAADIAFRAIAFGLFATAVLMLIPLRYSGWRIIAAVAAALASGVIWRLWLADAVQWVMRAINLSWSDETPSAWSRITQHNRTMAYSQMTVYLNDGTILHCNAMGDFTDAPFGPCIIGPNGDVALYVTHRCDPGECDFVAADRIFDDYHGDEITWIAASDIRRIKFRLLRAVNG